VELTLCASEGFMELPVVVCESLVHVQGDCSEQ